MKSILSILILFVLFNYAKSQIPATGRIIPEYNQASWNHAGLLPETRTGGLTPETPTHADHLIVISPGGNCDSQIAGAIQQAESNGGITMIFFPGGVFQITSPIVLRQLTDDSNIIFRGAGANATILEFSVGKENKCFDIRGATTNSTYINNNISKKDMSFISNTFSGAANDWVLFYEKYFDIPGEDGYTIGQITQITAPATPGGPLFSIKDEASKNYLTANTIEVTTLNPISNVGIEDLTIRRMDSGYASSCDSCYGNGTNIYFQYAVNCWVKGVHLWNTCRHHIDIDRSSHIEVSGCFIHHANYYGGNSFGYGTVLGAACTNCLIENNIFRTLRHAIGVVAGANSNVIAFNYSTDQYSTYLGIPYNDSDICIHGKYSYSNLYEHNYVEWIEADTEHGANGPFNAFFRNKVSRENNIEINLSPFPSVLGCEVCNVDVDLSSSPLLDKYGLKNGDWYQHFEACGSSSSEFILDDVSYYYSSIPDFINALPFPSIGPIATGYDTPTNTIPARERYFSGGMTYINAPTDFPPNMLYAFSTNSASLTKISKDINITFFNPPYQLGYASGIYICDKYELETVCHFCPFYSQVPYSWLCNTGYTGNNPNNCDFALANNTSQSETFLYTYFYFVKKNYTTGEPINEWIPWNPGISLIQNSVLGIPAVNTTSGSLSQDECWCGTQACTGDVTVPAGITLTIDPGASITFPDGDKLIVHGTLNAVGTSSSPIEFDCSDAGETWYGITFENGSSGELEYCTIRNASYGIYVNQSAPSITHCTFEDNNTAFRAYMGMDMSKPFADNTILGGTNGIYLNNLNYPNQTCSIENCTIDGAGYYGFRSSTIDDYTELIGNTVRNCGREGVRLYRSSPILFDNNIYSNAEEGIYMYYDTDPCLFDGSLGGNNVVAYNALWGIYMNSSSHPTLGSASGQWDEGNSYYSNGSGELYSLNSQVIDARNSWWGQAYTDTTLLRINGNFYCSPILDWMDPNPDPLGLSKASAAAASGESSETLQTTTVVDSTAWRLFAKAHALQIEKKFDEAIPVYQQIIDDHSQAPEAEMAVVRLARCYKKTDSKSEGKQEIIALSHNKASDAVAVAAELEAAEWELQDGNINEAIAHYEGVVRAKKSRSQQALYDLWAVHFHITGNKGQQTSLLKQYENWYGEDENVIDMKLAMGLISGKKARKWAEEHADDKELGKGATPSVESSLPKQFALHANYPNPFNPTTRIAYDLPKASTVRLEVFNVLGQRAALLLETKQEAGRHVIVWDGRIVSGAKAAAGLYFCRMTAGEFAGTIKMTLLP